MRIKAICLSIVLCLGAGLAHAEDQVACDASCDAGKVMTSYADGNQVTCVCVDEAQMDPTVADPDVPTDIDPNNTH